MCGIAGIISHNGQKVSESQLKALTDPISHRGPDGEGFWINDQEMLGMGHRRLAIIDTGASGRQPMHYRERYTISYNGEIYNYKELRKQLETLGHQFQTHSDTEVILAAFAQYGVNCLTHFDGMFALALFDQKENKLFCARDRFGEKPFFYARNKNAFVFASEMKSLWNYGQEKIQNDRMHYNHLAYGFMYNPKDFSETFYENIHRLPHAHYLLYDLNTKQFEIRKWWSISEGAFVGNEFEAKEEFLSLMSTSVLRRLRSDVPLGTSLSGGLDSSTVAALCAQKMNHPLKTFSAVYPNYKKDESAFVQELVQRVEAESFVCSPGKREWREEKEKFLKYQEEPVYNESPFLLYKVYELSKENDVTVLLDGQGADEILAGYHSYYYTFLREMSGTELYEPEHKAIMQLAHDGKFNDYAFFKRQKQLQSLFGNGMSQMRIWKQYLDNLLKPRIEKGLLKHHKNSFKKQYLFNTLNEHLSYDSFSGKLQNLLRNADRSSMAHSVEVRLPFLSHELVDFTFSLPAHYKIRNAMTKWILRNAMTEQLPSSIINRRDKIGAEGNFS